MTDSRKNRLIQIARSLSNERSGWCFHVAFILERNKILSLATNDYTNRHLAHRFGEYKNTKGPGEYIAGRHAETQVLKQFLNKFGNLDVSGLTLFVTRIGYKSEVMSSNLCWNCQRVVGGLNFKHIIWT